jgi:hypothetical protein
MNFQILLRYIFGFLLILQARHPEQPVLSAVEGERNEAKRSGAESKGLSNPSHDLS